MRPVVADSGSDGDFVGHYLILSTDSRLLDLEGWLEGWSVGVQFFNDILVHRGLFFPASGEKPQDRVGSSIWSRIKRDW